MTRFSIIRSASLHSLSPLSHVGHLSPSSPTLNLPPFHSSKLSTYLCPVHAQLAIAWSSLLYIFELLGCSPAALTFSLVFCMTHQTVLTISFLSSGSSGHKSSRLALVNKLSRREYILPFHKVPLLHFISNSRDFLSSLTTFRFRSQFLVVATSPPASNSQDAKSTLWSRILVFALRSLGLMTTSCCPSLLFSVPGSGPIIPTMSISNPQSLLLESEWKYTSMSPPSIQRGGLLTPG
mmetsp:Transcript_13908/g.28458  ORF Transcript_13908/g.28458 Transcript_13908/m.28458 type:complete len:237 (-) Transcript_13908:9149-9859(-)